MGKEVIRQGETPTQAVSRLLTQYKAAIQTVLPQNMKADRLIRLAVTAMTRTPQLQNCSVLSICNSIMLAAQMGLEVNTPLGHAYLIPYKDECTFQPGYKGLIDLALRSAKIQDISAEVVFQRDGFIFELGDNQKLIHKPYIGPEDPGDWIGAYSYIRFNEGPASACFMGRKRIEKIRDQYGQITKFDKQTHQRVINEDAPWFKSDEEMAKKTVIKRHLKLKKLSPELDMAIGLDDQTEGGGVSQGCVLDADFEQMAAEASAALSSGSTQKAQAVAEAKIKEMKRVTADDIPQAKEAKTESNETKATPAETETDKLETFTDFPDPAEFTDGDRINVKGRVYELNGEVSAWREVEEPQPPENGGSRAERLQFGRRPKR